VRVRVNLAGSAVKRKDFNRNGDDLLGLQSGENPLYDTVFSPPFEASVHRIPIAELFWQTPPLATIFGHVQNR
jgi:hypothetical protein